MRAGEPGDRIFVFNHVLPTQNVIFLQGLSFSRGKQISYLEQIMKIYLKEQQREIASTGSLPR